MSALLQTLLTDGGWMTRADLSRYGYASRDIRAARQASGGRIIFGQRGYRATECATLAEIDECAATLRSQADAMMHEASELWRVKNRRVVAMIDEHGQGRLAV